LLANCLFDSFSILLLMVLKSYKSYLYCFSETVWFFDIRADLFYRYYFSVSLDMLLLDVLTFTVLSLVTCLYHVTTDVLPPDT